MFLHASVLVIGGTRGGKFEFVEVGRRSELQVSWRQTCNNRVSLWFFVAFRMCFVLVGLMDSYKPFGLKWKGFKVLKQFNLA